MSSIRLITLLPIVILMLFRCDITTPPDEAKPVSESSTIDSSGGTITVQDEQGYTIDLIIPCEALDNSTLITVTSTGSIIANPVNKNVFPGLTIEPEDLLLQQPATIRITFPSSVQNLEDICVFGIFNKDYVIPLAEQELNTHSIEGKIYYFKKYAAGIPTEKEITQQVEKTKQRNMSKSDRVYMAWSENTGSCPPAGYGWQGTRSTVSGLLHWSETLAIFGNEEAFNDAIDAAEQVINEDIESFLEMDIPENPCGRYLNAAAQYMQASRLLDTDTGIADAIEHRVLDIMDQCAIRFSLDIDRYIKKEGNEKEETSTHGTVKSHIPWDDFSDGEGPVEGEGVLTYSSNYEWLYNQAMNYKSTAHASGTIHVTCEGHTTVKDTSGGGSEIWLHIDLHFKDNIKGESCDTADRENPCISTESHAEWNESYDFPFQDGYTYGYEGPTKDGYARDKITLHIINMDVSGSGTSDPGICY